MEDEDINSEKIVLSIRRYFAQRKLDHPLIKEFGMNYKNFETLVFELLEDYDASGIRHICRVATYEETIATYPKDWWQAVKERWFPKWLVKYHPVKLAQIIALHKFPHWEKVLGKERVQVITKGD